MPTKKLPLQYKPLVRNFTYAGPMPNDAAMKERFWGTDAICVWCGVYLYNLGNAMTPDVRHIYEDLATA